uniref:Apolipoprotein Db n=1 Tax=Oryzias latipes TaxID=8090 RepID=H2MD51_ORYLA
MSSICPLLLLLLLLLLPLISAQTFHWGPCPSPQVQPNFRVEKVTRAHTHGHTRRAALVLTRVSQQYLGRWYEIEKLPASFEKGTCIEANYSLRKDGTIQVLNSQFYKEKVRSVEGTAVIRDSREPAKLGVSFSYCESDSSPPVPFRQPSIHGSLSLFFLVTPYAPYWVLTTDYTSLSVVYSCTSFLHLFHIDYAWILSRSPKPSPSTVRYVKQLLVREGIDISRMKATVQNC